MIRRWSHINRLTNDFVSFPIFEKHHKISVFKSSVNFKRFVFKFTKFKRKALARIKHHTNWLPYTNVLQLWVKDFMFNKHHIRFQFYNKTLVNNFFFYNFNFIKNRNESFFYNLNFIFSIWSKKSHLYFYPNSFNYFKYSNITFAWLLANPSLNSSIVPVLNEWDNVFYTLSSSKANFFDLSLIFDFFFFLNLQKSIELKKIITLLFYYNTNNF